MKKDQNKRRREAAKFAELRRKNLINSVPNE